MKSPVTEESNYRVGRISSEMHRSELLRRAMADKRAEDRRMDEKSGRSSESSSVSFAPKAEPRTSPEPAMRKGNTSERNPKSVSATNESSAVSYQTDGSNPNVDSDSLPWHQKFVDRFFAAPVPQDPLRKNGRLYFVLIFFLCGFFAVLGKLFK